VLESTSNRTLRRAGDTKMRPTKRFNPCFRKCVIDSEAARELFPSVAAAHPTTGRHRAFIAAKAAPEGMIRIEAAITYSKSKHRN